MQEYKTIEQRTCLDVMNLNKFDATKLIRTRGLVDNISEEGKIVYPKKDPCFISHRINLKIYRGRVVSAVIG